MITRATVDELVSIVVLECGGFPATERWSGESWAAELGRDDHLVLVHRGGDAGADPDDASTVPAQGGANAETDHHDVHGMWHRIARSPIDAVAAFSVTDDFGDVLRVIVAPSAKRQGLGTALVRAGLEWLADKGATRALLEVSQRNAAGIALYEKLGFTQLSHRRDYYGPGEDAWVMVRPIRENA